MDVDQILALDRELTMEEFQFLEQETLKSVRELSVLVDQLLPGIAAKDPALAERLEASTNRMLHATEAGAAIPLEGPPSPEDVESLRDLARTVVRRPNRRTRRHH